MKTIIIITVDNPSKYCRRNSRYRTESPTSYIQVKCIHIYMNAENETKNNSLCDSQMRRIHHTHDHQDCVIPYFLAAVIIVAVVCCWFFFFLSFFISHSLSFSMPLFSLKFCYWFHFGLTKIFFFIARTHTMCCFYWARVKYSCSRWGIEDDQTVERMFNIVRCACFLNVCVCECESLYYPSFISLYVYTC